MSIISEVFNGSHQAITYTGSGIGLTDVPRAGIANGTPSHILINDNTGKLSSVAQVSPLLGGTGIDSSTLTGIAKIASGVWSASQLSDADIAAGASISRTKLALGSASHVVTNDGTGVLSSEAQLAPLRGGTGIDTSGLTGVAKIAAGIWSATTIINADISTIAAIARSKLAAGTANHVLINDATGVLSSEVRLSNIRGGTGLNSSTLTGVAKIAAGVWSAATIVDADVATGAAIVRSKLASGTANHVVINDGSGVLSSEAFLANTRGGTGINSSTLTGVAKIAAGVWSAGTIVDADVASGAAIVRSKLAAGTANHVVINDGTGALSSEAFLAPIRGGTGKDSSGFTGVAKVAAGVWTASAIVDADIAVGSAIARTKLAAGTANHVVINDGTGALSSEAYVAVSRGGTGHDFSTIGTGPFVLTIANGDVDAAIIYSTGTNSNTIAQRGSDGSLLASVVNMFSNATRVSNFTATVTTSNATATQLVLLTLPAATNGSYGRVSATIVYANKNGATLNVGTRILSFKMRFTGGTMTTGTVNQTITDNDTALATTSVAISASGANAIVNVTGVAATSITWMGRFEVTFGSF